MIVISHPGFDSLTGDSPHAVTVEPFMVGAEPIDTSPPLPAINRLFPSDRNGAGGVILSAMGWGEGTPSGQPSGAV